MPPDTPQGPHLVLVPRRRSSPRGGTVPLDRSLERLPLFRLSDSTDDQPISYSPEEGGRWRVLPRPGERLPGTFDQDVYVELMRRYHEADEPADGVLTFTLHAFLRSMGRRADGRTYEQLRAALMRLERTTLESTEVYYSAAAGKTIDGTFTILSSVSIERRRAADKLQLALFETAPSGDPGDARVALSSQIRENLASRHTATLAMKRYLELPSPVARRLYRLLEVARAEDTVTWRVPLERLRDMLPLTQRYPSHLQRVLQPAHDMLLAAGAVRNVAFRQDHRIWFADYVLNRRGV